MKKFICSLLVMVFIINILGISDNISSVEASTNGLKVNTNYDIKEPEPAPKLSIEKLDIDMTTASYNEPDNITMDQVNNTINSNETNAEDKNTNTENENIEEEVSNDANGTIAYASVGVDPYPGYMTKYMDLRNRMDITVDQMNSLIDYWLAGRDSKLKNEGAAFIEASNITGLDPIFLLALAGQESGWETSDLHTRKNNPYSIAMYDCDPEQGYVLGDEFASGIVNGAVWINDNYYNQGQTNLYLMIYGDKQYSSATDHWISSITDIITASYRYLLY